MRPPATEPIEVQSGSLTILNLRCSHIFSDEVKPIEKWDFVTDVYKKAQPGNPIDGMKKVTFTQHCETTLALDMLARYTQRKLSRRIIEIGVSKACCDWCCEYLGFLSLAYPKYPILVRATHGKQPDGWKIPPNGPKSTGKQMARLIEMRVDEVIWKIQSRRQSDSNELPDFTKGEADLEAPKKYIREKMFDYNMMDV